MLYQTRYQKFSTLYTKYLDDLTPYITSIHLSGDSRPRITRDTLDSDPTLALILLEAIDKSPTRENKEVSIKLDYRKKQFTLRLIKTPSIVIEAINIPKSLEERIKSFSTVKK